MVDLTILEVHLDSAEFTANTPFSDETTSEGGSSVGGVFGGDEDSETADDESSGGASPFAVVFAFVGLIVLTVVLRRVLGGSGQPVLEK